MKASESRIARTVSIATYHIAADREAVSATVKVWHAEASLEVLEDLLSLRLLVGAKLFVNLASVDQKRDRSGRCIFLFASSV